MVHLNDINNGDDRNYILDADVRKLIARANVITERERLEERNRKRGASLMSNYSKKLTELQDRRGQNIARLNILKKELEKNEELLTTIDNYKENYPDVFTLYTKSSGEKSRLLTDLIEKYSWETISKVQDLYHEIGEDEEKFKAQIQKSKDRIIQLTDRQNQLKHEGNKLVAKMNKVMDGMEIDE